MAGTSPGFAAGVHAWSGNAARDAELRSKLEFLAQIRYVPNTALAFAYNVPVTKTPITSSWTGRLRSATLSREPCA